jgi:hypothetical protein
VYGFACNCPVCSDPQIGKKFAKVLSFYQDLDSSKWQQMSPEGVEQLLQDGKVVIRLFEELRFPSGPICEVCSDLYDVAMASPTPQRIQYAKDCCAQVGFLILYTTCHQKPQYFTLFV